jgi:hypothetical protein fuD12_10897|nr:MAG TPA: Major head protein [Caudoviricetes sp.]
MSEEIKTFTQEEVNKLIEERVARLTKKFESEKKELERKHGETIEDYEARINNANLTAEEKYNKSLAELQKQLESSNSELATMKTNELKKVALGKYKIPDSFLGSISGNTEEEIENSVKSFSESLSSYLKTQSGGVPNSLNGGSNGEENKKDTGLEAFDKAFSSF